jgi:hypothetical protein
MQYKRVFGFSPQSMKTGVLGGTQLREQVPMFQGNILLSIFGLKIENRLHIEERSKERLPTFGS